jgi:type VI secretion system secreted protein Hcp
MAVDMYIKIDDIAGEAVGGPTPQEISVLSWHWGMTQSGSTHEGTGSGSGKVNVNDLTFSKYIDSSSPNLFAGCCSGKHFKKATFTIRKAGGKVPVEYFKLFLFDVLVSSVTTGGSAGEDRFTESVTLNFGQFEVDYTLQTAGGDKGTTIPMTWNIPLNSDKLTAK